MRQLSIEFPKKSLPHCNTTQREKGSQLRFINCGRKSNCSIEYFASFFCDEDIDGIKASLIESYAGLWVSTTTNSTWVRIKRCIYPFGVCFFCVRKPHELEKTFIISRRCSDGDEALWFLSPIYHKKPQPRRQHTQNFGYFFAWNSIFY